MIALQKPQLIALSLLVFIVTTFMVIDHILPRATSRPDVVVPQPGQAPANAPNVVDAEEDQKLVKEVNDAIEKAKRYLRAQRTNNDNWEVPSTGGRPGGYTCLALLALMNAGVKPSDEIIQNGLKYLRDKVDPHHTYVVGLQTMVYALAGDPQDLPRIQANVKWLLDSRIDKGDLRGWSYTKSMTTWVDYSNTQYALLGLHEAFQAGVKINREDLEWIRKMYLDFQRNDGGWGYKAGGASTITMTSAGICGLLITGMDLNEGREKIQGREVQNCGEFVEQRALAKALELLGQAIPTKAKDLGSWAHLYYALYGIERVGRLSGQRFLGGKDWYRIGCEYLIGAQHNDGSWNQGGDGGEGHPIVSTSFALLFLSKGRTPVLISKLTHDLNVDGRDWNNDPNDVRNLVEFTRKELFKNQALAWQVFDPRFIRGDDDNTVKRLAEELLQTPMVYITGHQDPHLVTSTGELTRTGKILQEYVENGGFVYVEACCGDERFHRQFSDQVRKMFKGSKLEELPRDHPVWSASRKWVSSPDDFKLYGIQLGCRTPLVYSKDNLLCCRWEINEKQGVGLKAFQLGANIVAYATGLEPPPERGTKMHIEARDIKSPPRGSLRVGQIDHGPGWQPAPTAMQNLMTAFRSAGFKDVDLTTERIFLDSGPKLFDYKFLYMHGRTEIKYNKEDLNDLRFNLESRGLLLADACCGSKIFDQSFRNFIKDLFPNHKLEPIPLDDELFGAKLNGEPITKVKCRRKSNDGQNADGGYALVEPELEGIKIDGRWVVVYSKYDIGCALAKHKSSDCIGHDHESAKRLGMAVVLYALRG